MPRVKHYFEKGHSYHITSRTEGGIFAFGSDDAKRKIVNALAFYRQRGQWRVHGFVVMANHVHVVASQTGVPLNNVVRDLKKFLHHELRGPGESPLWERRFDDNAIRHVVEMRDVVQYVHNNPVRIGLVQRPEDYFWSSASNYSGLTPVAMEIDRLEGPL